MRPLNIPTLNIHIILGTTRIHTILHKIVDVTMFYVLLVVEDQRRSQPSYDADQLG